MAAILNFRIFRKIAKHKNAYILKTVLDRVISTKFLTHRVSLQSSHANFQKNFILPKMAAILLTYSKWVNASYLLKVLQIANFSQITHSPTFGRAFTWWSFRPIANYSPTQNE